MSRTVLVIACTAVLCVFTIAQYTASGLERQTTVSPQVSFLGLTLEKDSLDDVRAKFGNSEVRKCSADEAASNEICYAAADGTKVVFEAGFSGGWTELDGYKIISPQRNPQCYRRCPMTRLIDNDLRTEGGLRLGLARQEVTKLLGKPTRATRTKLTFEWQSRRPMTKEQIEKGNKNFSLPLKDEYWDVLDIIDVTLSNAKVVEVAVRHIVSN